MSAKRGRGDSDDDHGGAGAPAPTAAAITGALTAFGSWVTANASAAGTAIASGTRTAAAAITTAASGVVGGAPSAADGPDLSSPPHLPSGRVPGDLPTHRSGGAGGKRGSGTSAGEGDGEGGRFAIGSGVDSDDDDAEVRDRVVAARGSAMAAKDLAVARRNAADLAADGEATGGSSSTREGGGATTVLGKAWESTRTGLALVGTRVADGARTVGDTMGPALSTAAKTVVDGTTHAATRAREAMGGTGASGSSGGGSGGIGGGGGGSGGGGTFKMPSVALPSFAAMAAATRLKAFSGAAADIVP
jgi:hypothetical protein